MKKIIGILTGVKEDKQTTQLNENMEECGMPGAMGSMPNTPPVTMSVNLNAQGVDNIKELLNLMRTAETGMGHDHSPAPMGMPMPAVGLDMPIAVTKIGGDDAEGDEPEMKPAGSDGDRGMAQIRDLIAKADKPKGLANEPDEAYAGIDSVTTDAGGGVNGPKDPADIRVKDPSGYENAEEEYANEPDEQYSDHNTMIKDLSGGLNREKQQYAKAQDGDNAMAVREASIRAQLDRRYKEIKEGRVDEWSVGTDTPNSTSDFWGSDIARSPELSAIVKQMKPTDYVEYNSFMKRYPSQDSFAKNNANGDRYYGIAVRYKANDEFNFINRYNRDNNNLTVTQWLSKAKNKLASAVTGKPEEKVPYKAYRYDQETGKGSNILSTKEKDFPTK